MITAYVMKELMRVYEGLHFYNFFSKTNFSSFCAFCVFSFESNVSNQEIKICVTRSNCYVILFSLYKISRSSYRRCSVKIAVIKNFAILTGKQVCWSLLLNVVKYSKIFKDNYLKNTCERLLLKLTL